MNPIITIIGDKVMLGPLEREAYLAMELCGGGDFVGQSTRMRRPPTPATLDAIVRTYERRASNAQNVSFLIYERATGTAIGTAGLQRIDEANRTAMFGIGITDPDARGKGYGTETARLILDYAFTALGLHSVFLGVVSSNVGAIRAYQKAGFREAGRRRQCWRIGDRWYDQVMMDCLATEFERPVLKETFVPDIPRQ